MINRKGWIKPLRLVGILTLCLALTACPWGQNVIKGARTAVAGISVYIDARVASGNLDPVLGAACKVDVGDAVTGIEAFRSSFSVAGGDKGLQAQAALTLERTWRAIYSRGNFGRNADVLRVVNYADVAISLIVTFYVPQTTATIPMSEKEFKRQLEAQIEKLKAATK